MIMHVFNWECSNIQQKKEVNGKPTTGFKYARPTNVPLWKKWQNHIHSNEILEHNVKVGVLIHTELCTAVSHKIECDLCQLSVKLVQPHNRRKNTFVGRAWITATFHRIRNNKGQSALMGQAPIFQYSLECSGKRTYK